MKIRDVGTATRARPSLYPKFSDYAQCASHGDVESAGLVTSLLGRNMLFFFFTIIIVSPLIDQDTPLKGQ